LTAENGRDLTLYGAIGALTAALGYVGSGDLPHYMLAPVGIALGGLVAVKAKLSQTKPAPGTTTTTSVVTHNLVAPVVPQASVTLRPAAAGPTYAQSGGPREVVIKPAPQKP
jgi:hypothetical protein